MLKESGLRIRVESQLKESFLLACKKNDLSAAQVLRAFMRSYIEQQSLGKQSDFFQGSIESSEIINRDGK
jgi:hypothetical protein